MGVRMGLSEFSCFTSGRVVMENMMRIPVNGSPGEVWGTLTDCVVIICMALAHGVPVLGPLCHYLSDTHLARNSLFFAGKISALLFKGKLGLFQQYSELHSSITLTRMSQTQT